MPRNKYPEETVNLILDVSLQLFIKKGFENTSIQDITNDLNGMSKGAIYHHFKSKDEILTAITNRFYERQGERLSEILENTAYSGCGKLKFMLGEIFFDTKENIILLTNENNPKMLGIIMNKSYSETANNYLKKVIEYGNYDKSFEVTHPAETAHAVLTLIYGYLNPALNSAPNESFERRFDVFKNMLESSGIRNIADESMREKYLEICRSYNENRVKIEGEVIKSFNLGDAIVAVNDTIIGTGANIAKLGGKLAKTGDKVVKATGNTLYSAGEKIKAAGDSLRDKKEE